MIINGINIEDCFEMYKFTMSHSTIMKVDEELLTINMNMIYVEDHRFVPINYIIKGLRGKYICLGLYCTPYMDNYDYAINGYGPISRRDARAVYGSKPTGANSIPVLFSTDCKNTITNAKLII